MLTINNLSVAYDGRTVLKGLTLDLEVGEFVIIVGANGAGKSTLFNAIAGSVPVQSGEMRMNGTDITHWPADKRSQVMAQVLQDPRLGTIGHMTILENLSFALKRGQNRWPVPFLKAGQRTFFKSKLALLGMGLEDRLDDLVDSLSGGQRQALSLLMAMLVPADLLLLDEITSALDPVMGEKVMELTIQLVKSLHATALMITHNLSHAEKYGGRVLTLQGGMLVKKVC